MACGSAAAVAPGSLIEIYTLGPHSNLLDQNGHFNDYYSPRPAPTILDTLKCEMHYPCPLLQPWYVIDNPRHCLQGERMCRTNRKKTQSLWPNSEERAKTSWAGIRNIYGLLRAEEPTLLFCTCALKTHSAQLGNYWELNKCWINKVMEVILRELHWTKFLFISNESFRAKKSWWNKRFSFWRVRLYFIYVLYMVFFVLFCFYPCLLIYFGFHWSQ